VRDHALWTVSAAGGQPVVIASGLPVLSFTWAPDHTELVYRGLDPGATARQADLLTPANLFIIGIDGGTPLQISPASNATGYLQPWWSADGNRLLYAAQPATGSSNPTWWVAQPDQPAGIARKPFTAGVGLPSLAPDGYLVALLSSNGAVVVATPGGSTRTLAHGAALVLTAGPATPARAIWRPGHAQILYPIPAAAGALTLMLVDLQGHTQPVITTRELQGYAWAPDGRSLLLQTGTRFLVVSADGHTLLSWHASSSATAYWSPDSRYVLSESPQSLVLADLQQHRVTTLLQNGAQPISPNLEEILHAAGGSPWAPNGDMFLMVTRGGRWNAQNLPVHHAPGNGLYRVTLSSSGRPAAPPTLIDWGNHLLATWTTLDTNSALVP